MSCKIVFLKIPQNSRQNSCERLLMVLVRISLVWSTTNLLMFCRIDCKSVFKVLSLSTEMQSSTDLYWWALNQCIKLGNSTQMITEVDLDIQANAGGNPEPIQFDQPLWNAVSAPVFFFNFLQNSKWYHSEIWRVLIFLY